MFDDRLAQDGKSETDRRLCQLFPQTFKIFHNIVLQQTSLLQRIILPCTVSQLSLVRKAAHNWIFMNSRQKSQFAVFMQYLEQGARAQRK